MPLGVRSLLRSVLPSEQASVEALIAWDAPIQLAGVVEQTQTTPDLDLVVTVGLTDLERVVTTLREMGANVDRLSPGVFQVSQVDEEAHCAVAAARGQAPARLVCGPSFEAVERLLPYATRGLPEAPAGPNDLEIEFNPEPIQRLYGQQISSLSLPVRARDPPAFARSPRVRSRARRRGLRARWGAPDARAGCRSRADRGKLDEPNSTIDLGVALKLKSTKSWLGDTLKEASARSGPPPELYWQLPDEATSASYFYPIDPARLRPLLRTAADLADGFLDHQRVSRASRDRVRNALMDFEATMVPYVQAEGNETPPSGSDSSLSELFSQFLGWQLIVAEGPAAPHLKVVKDLHAILNDRELRKLCRATPRHRAEADAELAVEALTGKGVLPGGTARRPDAAARAAREVPELDRGARRQGQGRGRLQGDDCDRPGRQAHHHGHRGRREGRCSAHRRVQGRQGADPRRPYDLAALRSTKAVSAGFVSLSALARRVHVGARVASPSEPRPRRAASPRASLRS